MFGTSPGKDDELAVNDGPTANDPRGPAPAAPMSNAASSGNGLDRKASDASNPNVEKKRRSSGVSRARDMFSSAKQSLHFSSNPNAAPRLELRRTRQRRRSRSLENQTQHSAFLKAPSTILLASLPLDRGQRSESE